LVGKPERKSIGKRRHRWEYTIRMDIREIESKGMDRSHLA